MIEGETKNKRTVQQTETETEWQQETEGEIKGGSLVFERQTGIIGTRLGNG